MIIFFPCNMADNRIEAMDDLFNVFPDHYPTFLMEADNKWLFRLDWPVDPNWYVDPNVFRKSKRIFNLSPAEIAPYYTVERTGNIPQVLTMFHSRALIAASLATQSENREHISHIIHVDDHHDLMPTFFRRSDVDGRLYEPVFGQSISLSKPNSIISSINSGVIHKGNFLTIFLLMNESVEVVYVNDKNIDCRYGLSEEYTETTLAGQQYQLSTLSRQETASYNNQYLWQTSRIPRELQIPDNGGVWLDIDLDAFCNRFDGDSDNRSKVRSDVEERELVASIQNLYDSLTGCTWKSRIVALSIAISPSFFPSDYWWMIPKICNKIRRTVLDQ